MILEVYAYVDARVFILPGDEDAMAQAEDDALEEGYATCPYRLQDGSMGEYGPNTCSMGCREEPVCVT